MAYTHGIYINEVETSIVAPVESDSAVIVAVGTAPINQIEGASINEPVIAYTYAEAVEKMGFSNNFAQYTLSEVIDAAFRQFGVAPIVMINVLDPTEHKQAEAEKEIEVTEQKAVIAEEGILLDTIVVKDNTGSVT